MTAIPPDVRALVDHWKSRHTLGELNPRLELDEAQTHRGISELERQMDVLVRSDNGPGDVDGERGVLADAGKDEIIRYSGDGQSGQFHAETRGGNLVCAAYSVTAIDVLNASPGESGYVFVHRHFSRIPHEKSYIQVAGNVRIIEPEKTDDCPLFV